MPDVQRTDVVEITSGPYSGEYFLVRHLVEYGEMDELTDETWLDSEATIHRRSESKNAGGQTDPGFSANATGVKLRVENKSRRGMRQTEWGLEPETDARLHFLDVTADAKRTDEARMKAL